MEKTLKYVYETVRRFGFKWILGTVSGLSWIFLPFVVWVQIFQHFGQSIFVSAASFPGWIAMLFMIAIFLAMTMQLIRLDGKLTSHVQYAKRVFDDPNDPKSEENFRSECNKFIVPYLHLYEVAMVGIAGIYRGFGRLGKLLSGLSQLFFSIYVSYSIMTFFVNSPFFIDTWTHVSSYVPYLNEVTPFLLPFLQNPIPSIALLFLLSLYFSTRYARRGYVSYAYITWAVSSDWFSIFLRIAIIAPLILSSPWLIRERSKTLIYAPFTFPTSIPEIMQKSIMNIENRDCKVTKWVAQVNDESGVQVIKQKIQEQQQIPGLVKIACAWADSRAVLKKIKDSKPVLFLGLVDSTCSILCRIEYDSYERMFYGRFYFDNPHVKDQFKSIAEIEITEQKKLKGALPSSVKEMLSTFGESQ